MVLLGSLCFFESKDGYWPFTLTALSLILWLASDSVLCFQPAAQLVKRHPPATLENQVFWSESCAHPKRVQSQTKKGQTVALKLSSLARDPPAQCSVDLVRNDKFCWQVTIMESNSACLLKIYFLIDQPKVALKLLKFAFKIIYHPYVNSNGNIC